MLPKNFWIATMMTLATMTLATPATAANPADEAAAVVTALDVEYQAAVERNDAATMARILADDFTLVTGTGKRYSKADLINEAQAGDAVYEFQRASERSAKAWGDTAVVTALLHAKGTAAGRAFEYRVWYSDTYVRLADGWRYVFGQSSLPLLAPR
jgi:ketosteroid isomerase-like protein